jgi:sulfatase modifying factor 1
MRAGVWWMALVMGCAAGGDGGDVRRGGEDPADLAVDGAASDAGADTAVPQCTPGDRSATPCPSLGVCGGTRATCNPAGQWGPCDLPPVYEPDEVSCDGLDNDCNGGVDEDWPGVGQPCDSEDEDRCALGQVRCREDATGAICADDEPVVEVCNGEDDDCDTVIDEPGPATPLAAKQLGVCEGARQRCGEDGAHVEPDYTLIPGYEAFEAACDGRDNDCDGRADVGLFPPLATRQGGPCAGLEQTCAGERGWQDPDFSQVPGFEAVESACDGLDTDCDGTPDNGVEPPECPLVLGVCAQGAPPPECLGPAGFGGCDYGFDYELAETDTCDTLDNDCDGVVDEGTACPISRQVVRLPAGRFTMGSPADEAGREADETSHPVEITRDLLVRRTEVTQDEWRRVLGENPARHPGADRPVEQISFADAVRFLNALSVADGLPPCYEDDGAITWPEGPACLGWRLPTEAEWEYLARAGTDGIHWGLDQDLTLDTIAWHRGNSGDTTRPVAQQLPDPNGLFDTLGNVAEWVFDGYGPYPEGPDPVATEGASRGVRGGSYATLPTRIRVANRVELEPASRNLDVGLRAVRTAPEGR